MEKSLNSESRRDVLVVIFRAKIRSFDDDYVTTANRMRDLALAEFGCLEFHAVCEDDNEVALSYWPDEESIRAWKAHPDHVLAQKSGKERWYDSYIVQVARIQREYHSE